MSVFAAALSFLTIATASNIIREEVGAQGVVEDSHLQHDQGQAIYDECTQVVVASEGPVSTYGSLKLLLRLFCEEKFEQVTNTIEQITGQTPNLISIDTLASSACATANARVATFTIDNQLNDDASAEGHHVDQAVELFCEAMQGAVRNQHQNQPNASFVEGSRSQKPRRGASSSSRSRPAYRPPSPPSPPACEGDNCPPSPPCLPADAMIAVRRGSVEYPTLLKDVRPGDTVAVSSASDATVDYATHLGDFHSDSEHLMDTEFLVLVHQSGSVTLTAYHFVATADHGFVPAKTLQKGDKLLVRTQNGLGPSTIVDIQQVTKTGRYAPANWHGNLIVDGVLTSSYALVTTTASFENFAQLGEMMGGWHNLHQYIHFWAKPFLLSQASRLWDAGSWWKYPCSWLHGIMSASDGNMADSYTGTGLPVYVDVLFHVHNIILSSLWS